MRLQKFLDLFRVLLRPSCWLQNEPFSAEWDRHLTWLLDAGYHFDIESEYYARIGPYRVWIANHPYASFMLRDGPELRPRRATILRAHRQLVQDTFATYGVDARLSEMTGFLDSLADKRGTSAIGLPGLTTRDKRI